MIDFKNNSKSIVSASEMKAIYDKIKAHVKCGAAAKWEDTLIYSSTVFCF